MISGQKYSVTTPTGGVTAAGATQDLFQLAPASNVPILLHRVYVTAQQTSAFIIPIFLLRRTTASTVGTALTPTNDSPAGPAASTVVTYNLSTSTGNSGTPLDSYLWEEFGAYEFNRYPDGAIIVPGTWCCLNLVNAGNSALQVGFTVEFTEIK